jgi:hypothetical protein
MAKLTTTLLAAAGFVALALVRTASAQPGEVQQRLDNQQQRINQGVASGELTKGEAARDESHLAADQAARNRDLAAHGGHLTPEERAHLNQRLNHNSARVYDTKHNDVVRPR